MATPPRPSTVPATAYWDDDDGEWVDGRRDENGDLFGVVEYYRPGGTLCCRTTFEAGTPHGPFQRFHENGEISRTGHFERGVLQGTNRFVRSTGHTTENFPRGLADQIWASEMDYRDDHVVGGRLYDRSGRQVMESGEPFPDSRPAGVPADAHFRKPSGEDDYVWVSGRSTTDEDNDVVRLGVWRKWTQAGVLISEEPHDESGNLHGDVLLYDPATGALAQTQRFEHGQRIHQRPSGVPVGAQFDEDGEVWTARAPEVDGKLHGQTRVWDIHGRLRMIETYSAGNIVRMQELLSDGSPGQDSTFVDNGVPLRKWFRRSEDEELDSFPNVTGDHPTAREVQYRFDAHGMMAGFVITDATRRVLESQTLYRNAAQDIEQRRFDSIEAASRAWTEEGERYTGELNRWLAELYGPDEPSFPEPTMDQTMERAVIEAVETLNREGRGTDARMLFPRYYDGIGGGFWHKYGLIVDQVLHAGTTIHARVRDSRGETSVMTIENGRIAPVPDAIAVGASHDKQHLAWAYDGAIRVVDSGRRTTTFRYPTAYGHTGADRLPCRSLGSGRRMGVRHVRVLPGGQQLLLISAEGIYLLGEASARRLYPLDENMDTYVEQYGHQGDDSLPFNLGMNFANADVSPDGSLITCGGMFRRGNMAGLAIWSHQSGHLRLRNTSQADAFFPMQATFQRRLPHVAFAATLYASLSNSGFANTTFRIDLNDLRDGEIQEFGGGVARGRGVVHAIASFGDGFLLGYDDGYVRWMGVEENAQLLGYLFVGGTIRDIDVSPDQKGFAVASDSGLVVAYRTSDAPSRHLITTMKVEDHLCAAFLRTYAPMLW
jgi:antitoxin component YwqK of YwqJK toxin-antitoxin module